MLLSHDFERWRSPGPANVGHEALACGDCHRRAPGTIRQQLQANARWLLGIRAEAVDFGLMPVSSEDCADCHRRPDDRHPIYRFVEPRFAKVRRAIGAERCVSCHREHTGSRVTVENGFCRHCHEEISIPNDPVNPAHRELALAAEWTTCLRCHDFHGNHRTDPPTHLDVAIGSYEVERYLAGGPSPWRTGKHTEARRRRSR